MRLRCAGSILCAIGLFAPGALAGAGARLSIAAFDAANDRPLPEIWCVLVDGEGTKYAEFHEKIYKGEREPASGDRLHVCAPGHEPASIVLDERRDISIRLQPDTATATIRLQSADAPLPRDFRWSLVFFETLRDEQRRKLTVVAYSTGVRGAQIEHAVSRSMDMLVFPEAEGALLWPARAPVKPGKTTFVHCEWGSAIDIRLEPGRAKPGPGHVELYPDLHWAPPGPPERITAMRSYVHRPGWRRDAFLQGEESFRLLPDAAFHFFGVFEDGPVYRYRAAGDRVLDLRGRPPRKPVVGRPVVNGEPAREGSLLATGRLDLQTLAKLYHLRDWLEGFLIKLGPEHDGWPTPELAACDWLTVWHPETGLAHLRWAADSAPRGRAYGGRLTMTAPEGATATGSVMVYPVWHGSGGITTVPISEILPRKVTNAGFIDFRGLQPGWYGVSLELVLRWKNGAQPNRVQRRFDFLVREPPQRSGFVIPLR